MLHYRMDKVNLSSRPSNNQQRAQASKLPGAASNTPIPRQSLHRIRQDNKPSSNPPIRRHQHKHNNRNRNLEQGRVVTGVRTSSTARTWAPSKSSSHASSVLRFLPHRRLCLSGMLLPIPEDEALRFIGDWHSYSFGHCSGSREEVS